MGLFSGMLSKRPIEFAGELAEKIVRQRLGYHATG